MRSILPSRSSAARMMTTVRLAHSARQADCTLVARKAEDGPGGVTHDV